MAEDDEFGLPNLHMIEDNLYLGDLVAATSTEILDEFSITHILTVDYQPLPIETTDAGVYTCLFIESLDSPDEDLLSHFEEAIAFIKSGIQRGAVLVHCFRGVSRSATIVCAYLMEKYNISSEDALTRVQEIRTFAGPNTGFMAQLQLFYKMNWKIDINNSQYRLYLIQLKASMLSDADIFDYLVTLFQDPYLLASSPKLKFKCKICRMNLFTEHQVFSHTPGQTIDWNSAETTKSMKMCTEKLFLTPLPWMDDVKLKSEGKLLCPNCKHKLGFFNLHGGRCTCEATMTPCFLITTNQVDQY